MVKQYNFICCVLFCVLGLLGSTAVFAQKSDYIPRVFLDKTTIEGKQFSISKTARSENFLMIWGDTVGVTPSSFPGEDLRFSPAAVLDTMEYIYRRCKAMGLVVDTLGTRVARYRFVIVMYGTFGSAGPQGFANGWAVDDTIGAFWVHPQATRDGGVIAHEFTHSLQAMLHLDDHNRFRNGAAIFSNTGLFYETHANYVRNIIYPRFVSSDIDAHHQLMLEPDWKVNYEGYPFLFHIHETHSGEIIRRMWTEWRPFEYPLQTLRRILNLSQSTFNEYMYGYARRAATWDYPIDSVGVFLRRSRYDRLQADWGRQFAQRTFDILQPVGSTPDRYYTPDYLAPQDYGYNVVPLYPTSGGPIDITFMGHTEVNDHAGWRYSYVVEDSNGIVLRYSDVVADAVGSLRIFQQNGDKKYYLVVMGAPTDSMHADPEVHTTWNGNPKRFHYPWEIQLTNAVPEGYQSPSLFRQHLKARPGHIHPNGGGWVDDRSTVSPTAYIAAHAIVLGNCTIGDNVRVLGTAFLENTTCADSTVISRNAFVINSQCMESTVVTDNCIAIRTTLSGNAILGDVSMVTNYSLGGSADVGGDLVVYKENASCSSGVYRVLTQYYRDEPLPCDNRNESHPENVSVNRPIILDTLNSSVDIIAEESGVYPNPTFDGTVHLGAEFFGHGVTVSVYDQHGVLVSRLKDISSAVFSLPTECASGVYTIKLTDDKHILLSSKLVLIR